MLPFTMLISLIMVGMNNFGTAIFFGIILSGVLIFINVFDYDKYDELTIADYLESKHKISFDFDPVVWSRIRNVFSNQLDLDAKMIDDDGDRITVLLKTNFLRPMLTAERTSTKIRLGIQYRYLKFIPDNARNYRIVKRLERKIKSTATSI